MFNPYMQQPFLGAPQGMQSAMGQSGMPAGLGMGAPLSNAAPAFPSPATNGAGGAIPRAGAGGGIDGLLPMLLAMQQGQGGQAGGMGALGGILNNKAGMSALGSIFQPGGLVGTNPFGLMSPGGLFGPSYAEGLASGISAI